MSDGAPSPTLVEAELERVLAWPGIARSPQLARFLSYIVEAKLGGDEASIKAYAIAVDVFGRPQDFDAQSDPIVRVQARRLRALLDEYYAGDGAGSRVRVLLPVGRYVPEFEFRDEVGAPGHAAAAEVVPAATEGPGKFRLRPIDMVVVAALLVMAVGAALMLLMTVPMLPRQAGPPAAPSVGVAEFVVTGGGREDDPATVAGLAVELVTDLQLFDDIEPSYMNPAPGPDEREPDFHLTGVARKEADAIEITATLRQRDSDTSLWTETQVVPEAELASRVDDLSRVLAERLGSHRGPLYVAANSWLDTHTDLAGQETPYLCGLLFTRYRDSASADAATRARDCVRGLLKREDSPVALAMRGALQFDDALATQPLGYDPEPLAEAARLLKKALQLGPTNSLVWQEYANYLNGVRRFGEADAAFASALQVNPANLDARASYGRMLSFRGESRRGQEMALEAVDRSPVVPHWYHGALAVQALRAGDDSAAIEHAEKLAAGDAELASVVATVAAFRSGNKDVLNRYLAQLLDVMRYRRFGILPVLRQRLPDTRLVEEIAVQLARAGVSNEALSGSF